MTSNHPDDPAQDAAIAIVITQVATPDVLAAACALGGVEVDAVATSAGAIAVCRRTSPGEPEQVAEAISKVLTNTPVLLAVRRDGAVVATRWASGQATTEVAPGLLLDGAPAELEGLLLGTLTLADLPEAVSSVGLGRWKATRMLAGAARAARRARKAATTPPAR